MKAVPLLVLLTGCYATGRVPVEAMRGLAGELDGPRMVKGERFGPKTMVRAELADGTRTGWFEAARLRVSTEGLMVHEPRATTAGARSAPGVRWSEARSFELRSLSPELSAMSIPLFPYVLLVGSLDHHAFDQVLSPTDGEGEGGPPLQLWSDAPTQPLFTGRARRRALFVAMASADAQATYRGDLATGLSLGGRFEEVWEFAFVLRPLSLAGAAPDGGRENALAYGGSMGMHIQGDSEARFGFYLGVELVGRHEPTPLLAVQLKWGPRLVLGRGIFLTVSPANLARIDVGGTPARPAWTLDRIVSSVELGGTF